MGAAARLSRGAAVCSPPGAPSELPARRHEAQRVAGHVAGGARAAAHEAGGERLQLPRGAALGRGRARGLPAHRRRAGLSAAVTLRAELVHLLRVVLSLPVDSCLPLPQLSQLGIVSALSIRDLRLELHALHLQVVLLLLLLVALRLQLLVLLEGLLAARGERLDLLLVGLLGPLLLDRQVPDLFLEIRLLGAPGLGVLAKQVQLLAEAVFPILHGRGGLRAR
mmetsp:Transcript_84760/g.238552  ORF Transcript_84760/g.238552 Transcript_84760/m.238552 type:complete len:223 (-) Transcript_84760:942-1610(-)